MAADTGATGPAAAADSEAAALAGLDRLEIPQARELSGRPRPEESGPRYGPSCWRSRSCSPSGSSSTSVAGRTTSCPGRPPSSPTCGSKCTTSLLWQAIGTTLRRAVIGFALALIIGVVIGALVSRIKPLRAAVGSMITALQTMPSIAWFPFAIILFGATTNAILFVIVLGAAPVDRQRADHRR